MLADSRLNIYILGSDLPPRQRERIQAQLSTAFRSLPSRVFDLVRSRIDALGVSALPLIIGPRSTHYDRFQVLSLCRIELRPAVKLTPRFGPDGIELGQDLRRLLAKAAAYISAPTDDDADFWQGWAQAVQSDKLRDETTPAGSALRTETDLGLLIEIFAARALNPGHRGWEKMPLCLRFS